jgi:cold shock protein
MDDASDHIVTCSVKWYNSKKGYGFLLPDNGGPDILLHANVLKNAGVGSVADGVQLEVIAKRVEGRWNATTVTKIITERGHLLPDLEQFETIDHETLLSLPYQPARVKWFDIVKGFGFANGFGKSDDVFIHIEVLSAFGLADLEDGEAVALRVIEGERGLIAVEVAAWRQGIK